MTAVQSKSFFFGFVSGAFSAWIFLSRSCSSKKEPELPSRPSPVVSLTPVVSISSPILSGEEVLAIGERLKLEAENNEWCEAVRAHKSRSRDDLEFPEAKKQRAN